jgi:hypothetical protein
MQRPTRARARQQGFAFATPIKGGKGCSLWVTGLGPADCLAERLALRAKERASERGPGVRPPGF